MLWQGEEGRAFHFKLIIIAWPNSSGGQYFVILRYVWRNFFNASSPARCFSGVLDDHSHHPLHSRQIEPLLRMTDYLCQKKNMTFFESQEQLNWFGVQLTWSPYESCWLGQMRIEIQYFWRTPDYPSLFQDFPVAFDTIDYPGIVLKHLITILLQILSHLRQLPCKK